MRFHLHFNFEARIKNNIDQERVNMKFSTPETPIPTEEEEIKIYQPAEDTFVLLDALEKDCAFLTTQDPFLCVEIGCGSGVVISFLKQMLGNHRMFLATDINPLALDFAQRTSSMNQASVEFVRTNLLDAVRQRVCGCVDLLVFNPPYVPTPEEEIYLPVVKGGDSTEGILAATWAGGTQGLAFIDLLIPQLKSLLSPRGVFYFVALHANQPRKLAAQISAQGLPTQIIFKRTAGIETLYVLKVSQSLPQSIPP